jgi:hypothetical protein
MVRGFRLQHADGGVERVRKRWPVQPKAGADEFEHQLRTALLAPTHTTKEVPTFAAHADELKKAYVLANKQTVRALDEGEHREASLASGVRRDAARCHHPTDWRP